MKIRFLLFGIALLPLFSMGQLNEKLDRGLVALNLDKKTVYIGWRLLKSDPENISFNIYRKIEGGKTYVRINERPITESTNFIDSTTIAGHAYRYKVTAISNYRENETLGETYIFNEGKSKPYYSIKLDNAIDIRRIGIADLDGDGAFDYVVLSPKENIDPYHGNGYWRPSTETLKLNAYSSKGKFMWRYDMGWAIESGTWYSPFLLYDIDQDGKAEVYAKAGEGDPRELDGRVMDGPEFVVKIDGESGKIVNKADWISREGYEEYNHWCRNFLNVAYFDGINPSLIMERGTYSLITTVSMDKNMDVVWKWTSDGKDDSYRGQGMHGIMNGDIDQDGKDELVIGTAALDDNGVALWRTGLGHNDGGFIADIDPDRPGYEIFYGVETSQPKNGVCLVDAKTGEIIWGYEDSTVHVHHQGMIGDFTDEYPGMECYAGEAKGGNKYFFYTAKGERLSDKPLWGLDPRAVWWDADDLKEICYDDKVIDYDGTEKLKIEGKVLVLADVIGDWREEIITALPCELRIYSTNIFSDSKKVCLMQNHLYRMAVADASIGYYNAPQIGFK